MTLEELLEQAAQEIVAEAMQALHKARLAHYATLLPVETRALCEELYEVILASVKTGSAAEMVAYSERLARERFDSGYSLFEIQTAINVMEECIWRKIMTNLPPSDSVPMLGLVGTVLGAGKDALSRKFVALASDHGAPSPSLGALFKGTDGV